LRRLYVTEDRPAGGQDGADIAVCEICLKLGRL
jgi:hypothetical protein